MKDSIEQLELLNELDEIIYICDPVTYELLFLNRQARLAFGASQPKGATCYQVFRGKTVPCEQCPMLYLRKGEQKLREVFYQRLGLHLMQKDKLIEWNGKLARLTVAADISKQETVSRQVRERLDMEQTLVRAIQLLTNAESIEEGVGSMLQLVGEYFHADRVYILEFIDGGYLCNTYEWCSRQVESRKEQLERIPVWAMERWADALTRQDKIITHSLEEIRYEHSYEYELWKSRQVHSLYAVPLVPAQHKTAAGYLTIENPKEPKELFHLLNSAAYFLCGEIYRKGMQRKLEYSSWHDALTGVYNRQKYFDFIQRERPENVPTGVIFANINGLKQMNAAYGYRYGNSVIFDMAAVLQKQIKGALVFRLGGDEFVVIAQYYTKEEFHKAVLQIKQEYATKESYSVSIGYLWDEFETDLLAMVERAEDYMLLNKQDYYSYIEADNKNYNKNALEGLLEALNEGMFEMYLQPKISLTTGQVVGAEALVRLNHPDLGLIPPGKFIPLLEEEKIIKYVDFFVFEEVCRTIAHWKEQGRRLIKISLNFSRITILEENLAEKIKEIQNRYDVADQWLEIEITETVGDVEREKIVEISEELKQYGYQISLDDFGARYSNLSLLTMMDFDMIKLDKSLIDRLVENRKSQIVVKRMIDTCKDMGIKSIAEGVETLEQAELLKKHKCDYAQGYYYGKPVRLFEFESRYQ